MLQDLIELARINQRPISTQWVSVPHIVSTTDILRLMAIGDRGLLVGYDSHGHEFIRMTYMYPDHYGQDQLVVQVLRRSGNDPMWSVRVVDAHAETALTGQVSEDVVVQTIKMLWHLKRFYS